MSDTNANRGPDANMSHGEDHRASSRCLSLDLEVGRNDNRIHALAGVRPDTDRKVAISRIDRNLSQALTRMDELAMGPDPPKV